jgi:hypothetical protein
MNLIGKAKALRILCIAVFLILNWGCAVKSPEVNMRDIDKLSSIPFDEVAVNAKETVQIIATIDIET